MYGAEGVILALAAETRRAGHEAHIAVFADKRRPVLTLLERARAEGLPAEPIDVAGRIDPLAIGRIAWLMHRLNVDLVHTHDYKTTIMGLAAVTLARKPLVATLHGDTAESPAVRLYEWLNYRALRFCDSVVAVAPGLLEKASRCVPPGRLSYISNGIDITSLQKKLTPGRDIRAELGVPSDAPLIGMVGRLAPEKSHVSMIGALPRIAHPGPPPHLLIAGDGPLRDALARAAQQHSVEGRVHLLGARSDLPDIYAALTLLVHPSLTEGLPLVVLEAAAFGVPIVASSVGAIPAVLEQGAAGVLVPPGDPQALARAVEDLLAQPDRAQRLGQRARARVQTLYSATAMTKRYIEEVYLPVLGGGESL